MENKEELKSVYKPHIAYKGFDKDLKCREEQFEIGKIYYKENIENPKLCSNQGYHYCNELQAVFSHYPNNGNNRFCEIEVLGNFTDTKDKCITTAFRVVKEIPQEEFVKLKEKSEREEKVRRVKSTYKLNLIKDFQTQYPNSIIGGSVALFLHGITLSRIVDGDGIGDLDVIIPFYQPIVSWEGYSIEDGDEERGSGADYEMVTYIDGIKVDIRIDPKERYDVIEFDGFKYKVNKLENIMFAKFKYAVENRKIKHIEDCYEICGKKVG